MILYKVSKKGIAMSGYMDPDTVIHFLDYGP